MPEGTQLGHRDLNLRSQSQDTWRAAQQLLPIYPLSLENSAERGWESLNELELIGWFPTFSCSLDGGGREGMEGRCISVRLTRSWQLLFHFPARRADGAGSDRVRSSLGSECW